MTYEIDISKKYVGRQLLTRTPFVITSNYTRFGRGHLPPTDENALCSRCFTYQFQAVYKPPIMLNSRQFYHFLFGHMYDKHALIG